MSNKPPINPAESDHSLVGRVEAAVDAAERSLGSRTLTFGVRTLFWLTLAVVAFFLGAIALTRFWLVPNADSFRPRIVEELSRLTHQRVALGSFEAGWNGWSPEFKVTRLQILDAKGRALLELPEVETTISWRSILAFEPRLSSLTVRSPRVVVRRDDANRLSIAGFDMDLASTEPSDPAVLEWLLRQRYVQIEGGEIEWQDAWRKLPPLRLRDVNIRLQNDGSRHRMGLRAVPATAIASPLELRSEFRGSDLRKIGEWDGSAYVRVDYANVGELAKYLPLPVDVVRGEGGLRAWFDFNDGRAVSVTTDLVLRDAQLRLRSEVNRRDGVAKTTPTGAMNPSTVNASTSGAPIAFSEVSGRLEWRDENVGSAIERFVKRNAAESSERWKLSDVRITPADRAALTPFGVELALAVDAKQTQKGELRASSLDLKGVDVLQASLAPLLPSALSSQRLLAAPRGQVSNLRASWQLDAAPIRFELSAQLNDVAWQRGSLPGVSGLTGSISITEKKGSFRFEPSGQATPTVFERWMTKKSAPPKAAASGATAAQGLTLDFGDWFVEPLNLGTVGGALRWEQQQPSSSATAVATAAASSTSAAGKVNLPTWLVTIDALTVANADARATISGTWRNDELGPGIAKLAGKLDAADALAVHRYLPKAVGETTRTWVREAIDGGKIANATFNLEGALWHFPFADGKHGKFELDAPVSGVVVDYADGWPRAENIEGTLNFRGSSFGAEVQRATIANAQIGATQVRIADMMANDASVEIKGSAQSSVENYLRFIATSPVNRMLDGFTERAKGSGGARLSLSLGIPIYHADRAKVEGEVSFDNNRVELGGDIPPLDAVNGRLRFTDKSVSSRELRASAFGGPVAIDIATDSSGVIKTAASGRAELSKVRELYDYPLLDQLRGAVDWKLDAQAATRSSSVPPTLSLNGTLAAQTLPIDRIYQVGASPRDVTQPIAFALTRSTQADGRDRLEFELPALLHTIVERAPAIGNAPRVVERAVVDLGAQKTQLPVRGYSVRGELTKLDTDAALDLLPSLSGGNAKNVGGLQSESSSPDFVNVNVRAERALVFGHVLNEASLRAQPGVGRWRLALRSKEATGLISVESSEQNGAVNALAVRLQRFALPNAITEKDRLALAPPVVVAAPTQRNSSTRWPKLDLTADSFVSDGRELGKLEIAAQPGRDEWRIDRVRLSSADGSLEAKGRWQLPPVGTAQRGNGNTAVDVALDWKDAGKFMQRFGLPKGVERGEGQLRGELSWAGSPSEFGYDKLDGKIVLKTGSGRFTEMDPGIGKLLGVISLQSIPRRLTFNFDDLFGRGYAFDTIGAEVAISKGKARTENFEIAGPAARVEIRGDAELDRETAQLRVRVFPSISVATAIGIGLATANPAIGAAAWLGQKIARDPVERLLMSEFEISGSWANPDVKQTRGVGATGAEVREAEAGPAPAAPAPVAPTPATR